MHLSQNDAPRRYERDAEQEEGQGIQLTSSSSFKRATAANTTSRHRSLRASRGLCPRDYLSAAPTQSQTNQMCIAHHLRLRMLDQGLSTLFRKSGQSNWKQANSISRTSPTFSRTPNSKAHRRTASALSGAYNMHTDLDDDRDAAPSPVIRTSPSPIPRSPTPRQSGFNLLAKRASSPLPESHPAFGMSPLEVEDSKPNLMAGMDSSDMLSSPPTTAGLTNSTGISTMPSTPATPVTPVTPKSMIPLQLNTNLPSYILDQIHPCIPFPSCWTAEHDQYIVYLDVQDYLYPSIVYRVKQRFPYLEGECITPGMIEKRLNILDLQPHCDYFKRAMALNDRHSRGRGSSRRDAAWLETLAEVDSCGGTDGENTGKATASSSATPRKRHDPNDHRRRVSTGGLSGKIVIAKGKATVVTNSGGGSFSPRPRTSPGLNSTENAGEMASSSVPSSPMVKFAKMGKGKKVVRLQEVEKNSSGEEEMMGLPSVMRTSSGKPVLG